MEYWYISVFFLFIMMNHDYQANKTVDAFRFQQLHAQIQKRVVEKDKKNDDLLEFLFQKM